MSARLPSSLRAINVFKVFVNSYVDSINIYFYVDEIFKFIFQEPMMIEAEEPTRSRRTSIMSDSDYMQERGHGDAIDGAFKRAMKQVAPLGDFDEADEDEKSESSMASSQRSAQSQGSSIQSHGSSHVSHVSSTVSSNATSAISAASQASHGNHFCHNLLSYCNKYNFQPPQFRPNHQLCRLFNRLVQF